MNWHFNKPKPTTLSTVEIEKQKAFNRKLTLASSQLLAISQQLTVTIEENKENTRQILTKATEMADLNQSAREGLQSIVADINSTDRRFEKIKAISAEMVTDGKSSIAVLPQSLDQIFSVLSDIHAINQATQDTFAMMQGLRKVSLEIVTILDTVSALSRQSNLLALNAAIESSRAGEAGAGFRVVADEMRKLSNSSHESVQNITSLIGKIHEAISGVNDKIRINADIVGNSVRKLDAVESNLKIVQSSFEDLVAKSEEVNSSIVQEREMASAMQRNVLSLSEKSSGAVQKVEQVYQDLQKQNETTEGLNQLSPRLTNAAELLESMVGKEIDKMEINEDFQRKSSLLISQLKESASSLSTVEPGECARFLQRLLNENRLLEAAWINDPKGQFVHSIPAAGIANARAREWFAASVQGRDFLSEPYISAITGQPCVTFSMPVYDAPKTLIGVLGVDFQY